MPYNSQITRVDAADLIPEDVSREIVQGAAEQAITLRLMRRLPNMTTAQSKMPVLAGLPTAYFVTGDTGLKQTTEMEWSNKYIYAEELAVIVPIPEAVLDDSAYDIWGEVRPRLIEALGVAIDDAIITGTGAPANWPDDFLTATAAAGNTIQLGDGNGDLIDDINMVMAQVEADSFEVRGWMAPATAKSRLRGLRGANGELLFVPSITQGMPDVGPYGLPIGWSRNGVISEANFHFMAGDFSQLVYAIRQDVTYKLLTEAVIQDGTGAIVYNLAQQDMVALRVVMRLGWQCPNPIHRMQPVEANRYPAAVILPA
jgi:HK97 family phage major capsid protein